METYWWVRIVVAFIGLLGVIINKRLPENRLMRQKKICKKRANSVWL